MTAAEFDVEQSIERTTGYVLWVYTGLVMVLYYHLSDPGAAIVYGQDYWLETGYFVTYATVIWVLLTAASNRVNPFEHPRVQPHLDRVLRRLGAPVPTEEGDTS